MRRHFECNEPDEKGSRPGSRSQRTDVTYLPLRHTVRALPVWHRSGGFVHGKLLPQVEKGCKHH